METTTMKNWYCEVKKTGKTWSVVRTIDNVILEGGFFSKSAAIECAIQTRRDYCNWLNGK